MGISETLKHLTKKAENSAAEHKEQLTEAVEKAEATADKRSGGKYHEQITGAAAKAKSYVEKLEPQAGAKPAGDTPPPGADPPGKDAG